MQREGAKATERGEAERRGGVPTVTPFVVEAKNTGTRNEYMSRFFASGGGGGNRTRVPQRFNTGIYMRSLSFIFSPTDFGKQNSAGDSPHECFAPFFPGGPERNYPASVVHSGLAGKTRGTWSP